MDFLFKRLKSNKKRDFIFDSTLTEINKIVEELEELIKRYYPRNIELENFYMNTIFASVLPDDERLKMFKTDILPAILQLAEKFNRIKEQLITIEVKLKQILNI
jgi:hypothetical protein